MALAVDASTPAFVSGTDPWVSASFTPPNDSLLVVKVSGDWFGGTPVITVTSTGLTFAQAARFGAVNQGLAEIWIAKVGSNGGTSRTVSVDTSIGSNTGGAKVEVWTDFRATVPVDAAFGGSNVTTNNFTANLTTGYNGCWVTGVGTDWQNLGAATSTDVNEHGEPTGVACLVVRKSAATTSAGAATLNFDAAGTGTPLWTWAALSIAPSSAPDPPVWYVGAGSPVAGTTSITTAAYPADWAVGDKIICTVASNHATTEATEPTVDGFTSIGTLNGGGGTQGAGTGNRRLTFFERDAQSGDDTTPTVSLATGNVMVAAFSAFRTAGTFQTTTVAFGAETTAGTGWSQAMTSDPGLDAGDCVLLACAVRDTSDSSAETLTATGCTFDTPVEITDLSSETGNDIALHVSVAKVLTGPSSAAGTRAATHSTSETGVMGVLRVRATATASGTGTAEGAFGFTGTAIGTRHTAGVAQSALGFTAAATGTGPMRFVAATAGTGTASYFADQVGNPILVRGYVLWGLLMNAGRWAGTWQTDLEDAVAGLEAIGCNVVYTEPLGNTQNGGAFNNGNTWDSVAPFTGGDPATFNNTFWQRSDYLFDLCEAAGITVFFNFAYSDDLDTAALSAFTTGDFTDYGTSLAARYKTRPNLVWMMGGDYFDTDNTAITAVKTAIRAEGDTHLFGVQNYPETTSRKDIENNSTQDTGTDNSEFNFVYSYNTTYWGIEYAYSEASPVPVMWGDGHFDQDSAPDRKVMRDLTWWAFSSGGRGMIFGSEGTWAWGSGALANLTSDTFPNTDLGGMWELFTGFTNWHQLVPDTDSSFVTAGRGTKSDYVTSSGGGGGEYNDADTQAPYVTAAITADGTLGVVYFPVDQTITVDDTELAAGYTATWVDPISGAASSATIASTYSPTGNNSLGGPDWLLVFEASASAVTGQATGSFGFTGAGNGVDRAVGTAVASLGYTATASGVDTALGAAVTTFGFAATSSGIDRAVGLVVTALGFTAAASGVDRALGVAAATVGYMATAGGVARSTGQAVGSLGFTGTASGGVGTPPVTGQAVAVFGYTATTAGVPRTAGTAAASFGFTGSASGVDRAVGAAATVLGFVGAAQGVDRSVGTAASAFGFTATAAGVIEVFGVAAALLGFTGSAQGFAGTPPVTGTATGLFGFAGTAQGQPRGVGTAAAGFGFAGSVQGRRVAVALAVATFSLTGTAAGVRRTRGVAAAALGFTAASAGIPMADITERPFTGITPRPNTGTTQRP